MNMTMRTRLITAFVLIALIPIGLLALLNDRAVGQTLINGANQALYAVSLQTATSLDTFMSTNLREIETEAGLPMFADYLTLPLAERAGSVEESEVRGLLQALSRKDMAYIDSYALLDSEGTVQIATFEPHNGKNEADWDYFDYFQGEEQREGGYVSPLLIGDEVEEGALFFSHPIYAETGDMLGLLRVQYHADKLQDLLAEKNDLAGPGSFAVLFDEYHIHLAHGIEPDVNFLPITHFPSEKTVRLRETRRLPNWPDEQLFMMQLDDLELHLSNIESQRFFEAEDVATGTLINQVAMSQLSTQPWIVAMFQPQEIFLAPSQAQNSNALLIASIIGVVAVAAAFLIGQLLAKPIVHLTDTVSQFTAGDIKARAKVESHDEIGILAQHFNQMAQQVGGLITGLQKRTSELADANAEITILNETLQEENLRMGAELHVAQQLQQMLLPTTQELRSIEHLDIAAYMAPADEVGGDYYDILQANNGTVTIGIGDVTGHGLESSMLMLMTQMGIRTLLAAATNGAPLQITNWLDILNYSIYANAQRMDTDKNLSLSLLEYTPGQVRLSGQHEKLIVVRRDGTVELVDTERLGFPIGLDDEISDFIDEVTVCLGPGDGMVLYTDGITEAENESQEEYGLSRLCDVVSRHWTEPAEAIKEVTIDDVRQHIGQQEVYDDITLVVVKQKS